MTTRRTPVKLHDGAEPTFDTELIFNRTVDLINSIDVDQKVLFDHDLA